MCETGVRAARGRSEEGVTHLVLSPKIRMNCHQTSQSSKLSRKRELDAIAAHPPRALSSFRSVGAGRAPENCVLGRRFTDRRLFTVALFAFAMVCGKGRGRRGGGNASHEIVSERRRPQATAPSKTTPMVPAGRVTPPEHGHGQPDGDRASQGAGAPSSRRCAGSAPRPPARRQPAGESLGPLARAARRRRARRAAATARGREDGSRRCEPPRARRRLGGRARRRQLAFDASRDTLWLLSPSPLVALGVATGLLGGGDDQRRAAPRAHVATPPPAPPRLCNHDRRHARRRGETLFGRPMSARPAAAVWLRLVVSAAVAAPRR